MIPEIHTEAGDALIPLMGPQRSHRGHLFAILENGLTAWFSSLEIADAPIGARTFLSGNQNSDPGWATRVSLRAMLKKIVV